MKYRKKPVVIEAYQTDKDLDIETLEGTMHASAGDYIITGVRGEQYPCKPDIFKQTYEPADTQTIDAVPVVRCGECKYRGGNCGDIDNDRWCYQIQRYVDWDWYCADGERRSDGEQ